jgi:hypothetical protein
MRRLILTVFLSGHLLVSGQSYFKVFSGSQELGAGNSSGEATYSKLDGSLGLPIKLKNDRTILVNMNAHRLRLDYPGYGTREYIGMGLNPGFHWKTEGGSALIMAVLGTYYFGDRLHKGLQQGMVVLISRKRSDAFTLKYGLYVNQEYFTTLIVPLLGLDWKVNEKWRFFGVLPQTMQLEHKRSNMLRYGLNFEAPLKSYTGTFFESPSYMQRLQIHLGAYADIYMTENIVLNMGLTLPYLNTYKIFNADQTYNASMLGAGFGGSRNEDPDPITDMQHGLIIKIGLQYRVEIE